MAAQPTFVSFNKAEVATTNVATTLGGGYADGFIVADTLVGGATVTLADGGTIAIGAQTLGTFVPLRCTKVVFGAGSLVFVQAN